MNIIVCICKKWIANEACEEASINKINLVYCSGALSCFASIITDVNMIMCTSWMSCASSTFENVKVVYVTARLALDNTLINLSNESFVYLLIPTGSRDLVIYCDVGYHCTIVCGFDGACENVIIDCAGNCDVLCEFNGNVDTTTCNNDTIPTNVPTKIPTDIPTIDPTAMPTMIPTAMPSVYISSKTDDKEKLERDLQQLTDLYYFVIGTAIAVIALILAIGYIDARWCIKNELFHIQSVVLCTMYMWDFFSGMMFRARIKWEHLD